MKRLKLLMKALALVACLLCSLSAAAAEAYAEYTSDNRTLTFYYDNLRSSRTGTTYDLNTGTSSPGWRSLGSNGTITKVVFDSSFASARPTTTCGWFYYMRGVTSITGIQYLNTSQVTNMNTMFFCCDGLTSLDLSGFNTANVTDMSDMFRGCSGLTSLNVSGFNTAEVNNMSYMFNGCSKLTSLNVSSFNTSKVSNMSNMFGSCMKLTSLDVSNFNTAQVTDMSSMFSLCTALTSLDVSNLNTAKVTNMSGMFKSCRGLTSLDLSNFNTGIVQSMSTMFSGCTNLVSVDLSSFNTAQVTNMNEMFYNCGGLKELDLSSFNTAQVTNMTSMLRECRQLVSVYVGDGWNTDAVTSSANMFTNSTSILGTMGTTYDSNHRDKAYAHIDGGTANPGYLSDPNIEAYVYMTPSGASITFYYDDQRASREVTGTTYDLNRGANDPAWHDKVVSVKQVVFDPSFVYARPTSTYNWFGGMYNLESISGMKEYLNTSAVTNMAYMFYMCQKLTSLDVSGFNTAKVTDMKNMFNSCKLLTELDVSGFSTANVTDMKSLFNNCQLLTELDVSGFSTANVTDMSGMFNYCQKLTSLNVSSFNTAKVTDMNYMFSCCQKLTSLDVSSFNTDNVTDMSYMFSHCSGLTALDLSGFSTYNVRNMYAMFAECYGLTSLNVSGFRNYGTNMGLMFYECRKLTSLDLSNFLAYQVTNLMGTFYNCKKLTNLDLSWFETSIVTNMSGMFAYCNALTSLDLSGFNTSNVTNMEQMFFGCISLTTIYAGDEWSTAAVTNSTDMFKFCTILVGGMGTTFDENHIDKTYAHIDGGSANPGYFTAAGAQPWTESEAYACYTPSNATLTFYYDGLRNSREGTTYDLNEGENAPEWISESPIYPDGSGGNPQVTHVVFDPSFADARPTSTNSWFMNMMNLDTITGMEYLNTANVTDMEYMFGGCSSLTSLDVSHFDTYNVTDMSYMFYGCSSLTSLDVTNFDTYKVSIYGMYAMFSNCYGLTSLDLSSFNTSSVESMREMFRGCSNLVTIYVGDNWNTASVTNSTAMFEYCTSLVGGQGTTYNESNPMDKAYAHIDGGTANPGYFTAAGAQPWTEPEAYVCYTSSNATLTFYYDGQRSSREGRTYDLNEGNVEPGWNGIVYNIDSMVIDPSFADARPTSTSFWFSKHPSSIVGLNYLNTSEVTDMSGMFYDCSNLKSLDLSHFNTENVTDMQQMFYSCDSLTSVDLCSFNTAKVTDMSWMFTNCYNLTTLDLSSFNTANVESMHDMFHDCFNLATIYVGDSWNTDAVFDSNNMFQYCVSLVGGMGTTYDENHVDHTYAHIDGGPSNPGYFTDINPPAEPVAQVHYNPDNTTLTFSFDSQRSNRDGTSYFLNEGYDDPQWLVDGSYASVTQVVFEPSFADARPTSTCSWFWGMSNLQSISGLEYLNTSEVTIMWGMFTDCSSLTVIDASNFDTGKVTNALIMFEGCTNLTTIYGGDGWNTNSMSVSSNMFTDCFNLVGGKGTTYDANHTNKYYARIDGGPSNPGYFTEKVDFLRGDVDGDGQVKIGDVTALINYLLSGDASGINLQAADVDTDGQVKIGDVTTLINYLLSGAW